MAKSNDEYQFHREIDIKQEKDDESDESLVIHTIEDDILHSEIKLEEEEIVEYSIQEIEDPEMLEEELIVATHETSDRRTVVYQMHSSGKEYICEICEKIFTNSDAFKTHKTIHEEMMLCIFCNVKIIKKSFEFHMQMDHSDRLVEKEKSPRVRELINRLKRPRVVEISDDDESSSGNDNETLKEIQRRLRAKNSQSHRVNTQFTKAPSPNPQCRANSHSESKKKLKKQKTNQGHMKLIQDCLPGQDIFVKVQTVHLVEDDDDIVIDELPSHPYIKQEDEVEFILDERYASEASENPSKHSDESLLCPFVCSFCKKTFSDKNALEIHKEFHYQISDCKICGTRVLSEFLGSHMKSHCIEIFKCLTCGATFKTENNLKQHENSHGVKIVYTIDKILQK